jgi:predicted nucleotidyltransferase
MKKLDDILEGFKRDVVEIFGNDLVSIILYGSAATNEYDRKRSDINTLVVLNETGIADIWRVHPFLVKWRRKRIACPYFMTRSYIEASVDSFPIEFLNMRFSYQVLFGENVLKDLKFQKQDLRLQCERELKGKLLHLRQGIVLAGTHARDLRLLIVRSLATFTSIFRVLLYLKNKNMPKKKIDILTDSCETFGLSISLFKKLYSIRERKIKLNRKQLITIIKEYIAEIDKLCMNVDQLTVKN